MKHNIAMVWTQLPGSKDTPLVHKVQERSFTDQNRRLRMFRVTALNIWQLALFQKPLKPITFVVRKYVLQLPVLSTRQHLSHFPSAF